MAGARALWRAVGMKEEQFGKPIIAVVNSFTQFVPGHVHLHEVGQLVKAEIEKLGCFAAEFNTIAVDDQTALRMRRYYPTFSELVGQTVKKGTKFRATDSEDADLYTVIQPELTIQEHYPPGVGTESLYTRIDEQHDGTKYDPIPYNGNMALQSGKYYIQNNILYLCNRDTVNPVYNALAELVGLYVEVG